MGRLFYWCSRFVIAWHQNPGTDHSLSPLALLGLVLSSATVEFPRRPTPKRACLVALPCPTLPMTLNNRPQAMEKDMFSRKSTMLTAKVGYKLCILGTLVDRMPSTGASEHRSCPRGELAQDLLKDLCHTKARTSFLRNRKQILVPSR